MAAGYRHRSVEQAANFVDGWYRTGDRGRLDAVVGWPGRAVDSEARVAAVRTVYGGIADRLQIMPVDRIPLTEQGKPDRPAIRRPVK